MQREEKGSTELKSLEELRAFEPRRVAVQLAVQLAVHCLALSGELPHDEQQNLAEQIRRSAVSVASNIAEGFGRRSPRGYAHYIMIAHASLLELDTQLEIALTAGYLAGDDLQQVRPLVDRVTALLRDIVRDLGPLAATE